jgi:hypothetical protein
VTRQQVTAAINGLIGQLTDQLKIVFQKRDERMAALAATLTELTTKVQALEAQNSALGQRVLELEASQAAQVMRD